MVGIGGRSRDAGPGGHIPPKLTFSCSSLITGVICGNPSRPFTKGYSTGSPKQLATCRNCAGSSVWPRKNTTQCSSHAARIAATVASLSSCARSMPSISAPSAPESGRISSVLAFIGSSNERQFTPRGAASPAASAEREADRPRNRAARRLAFHHDRALRSAAAGEGDGRRRLARRGRLLQGRAHFIGAYFHQARCDIDLLFDIISQSAGCKDRFLERRRIVSHPARAILCFPGRAHCSASFFGPRFLRNYRANSALQQVILCNAQLPCNQLTIQTNFDANTTRCNDKRPHQTQPWTAANPQPSPWARS